MRTVIAPPTPRGGTERPSAPPNSSPRDLTPLGDRATEIIVAAAHLEAAFAHLSREEVKALPRTLQRSWAQLQTALGVRY